MSCKLILLSLLRAQSFLRKCNLSWFFHSFNLSKLAQSCEKDWCIGRYPAWHVFIVLGLPKTTYAEINIEVNVSIYWECVHVHGAQPSFYCGYMVLWTKFVLVVIFFLVGWLGTELCGFSKTSFERKFQRRAKKISSLHTEIFIIGYLIWQ